MSEKAESLKTNQVKLDDNINTKLLDKHYSPLVVRKLQVEGWPMYVGIICDYSLTDFDVVISRALKDFGKPKHDLQVLRNLTGYISEYVIEYYNSKKPNCVEGVAVLWYTDKCFISSLWGDFMTHLSCKTELYSIINTLPHV
jgi:hypothetical protein